MKRLAALLAALLCLLGTADALAYTETFINGIHILQFGSVYCTVRENGNNQKVPTAELTFSDKVPDEKKLAVIDAPRLGEAKMRKRANEKSAVFYTCKAGWVCAVLSIGKTYARIHYQGVEGYVKVKSLRFFPAADAAAARMGTLSYQGRITGKREINVRGTPSKKSAVAATWPVGTEVYLHTHENGWWEVEARGIRGYVLEEYVTAPSASPENAEKTGE